MSSEELAAVSGQVTAQLGDAENENNHIPNEGRIAETIASGLPKPLCDEDILPCQTVGDVVKVTLHHHTEHHSLLPHLPLPHLLSNKDQVTKLVIRNNSGEDALYADGAYVSGRPGQQDEFVLKDKTDKAVVLCRRQKEKRERTFLIYGLQALHEADQENVSVQANYDSGELPFYPWYKITSYSKGNFSYRFISLWNAETQSYQPIIKLKPLTPPQQDGPLVETTKRLIGRHTTPHQAVALQSVAVHVKQQTQDDELETSLRVEANFLQDYGILERNDVGEAPTHEWTATLAPGVDPALGIVTAAIVADMPDYFAQEQNPVRN